MYCQNIFRKDSMGQKESNANIVVVVVVVVVGSGGGIAVL